MKKQILYHTKRCKNKSKIGGSRICLIQFSLLKHPLLAKYHKLKLIRIQQLIIAEFVRYKNRHVKLLLVTGNIQHLLAMWHVYVNCLCKQGLRFPTPAARRRFGRCHTLITRANRFKTCPLCPIITYKLRFSSTHRVNWC